MPRTPWQKWYWGDWRSDPRLRLVSWEAGRLWFEMCGYMHEGSPYGHLVVEGRPVDARGLAALVGQDARKVVRWLDELMAAGIPSVDPANGCYYSRRMVRDEEKRAARAPGGSLSLTNPNVPKPKHLRTPSDEQVRIPSNESEGRPHGALPDARCQMPVVTEAVSNETGAATAAPLVDNSQKVWLAMFMPMLRECGFEADDTDGSILKHWHKRGYTQDEVEAAIRGTAAIRAGGGLSAFADCKLSLRLLYARPKEGAPPERRPLWNEAVELYHRQQERTKRADPNAGNAIASILGRIAKDAA